VHKKDNGTANSATCLSPSAIWLMAAAGSAGAGPQGGWWLVAIPHAFLSAPASGREPLIKGLIRPLMWSLNPFEKWVTHFSFGRRKDSPDAR